MDKSGATYTCWNFKHGTSHVSLIQTKFHAPNYFTYQLRLDKKLRSNITLVGLHTHVSSLLDMLKCDDGHVMVVSKNGSTVSNQIFCGQHSRIVCFPPSNKVDIVVMSKPFLVVKVAFFHSVTDYKTLETTNAHIGYVFGKTRFYSVRFIQKNTSLSLYKLDVFKYCFVSFQLLGKFYAIQVLDGPSHRSQKVPIRRRNWVAYGRTMSFQALVYYYGCHNVPISLSYGQIAQKITKMFTHTNISKVKYIMLPDFSVCTQTPVCLIQINIPPSFNVKMQLENMTHIGPSRESCQEGGLAIFGIKGAYYHHLTVECIKNHYFCKYQADCYESNFWTQNPKELIHMHHIETLSDIYPHFEDQKSFHLSSSSVLIVYYTYPEYGSFSVNIKVEITTCRLFSIGTSGCLPNMNMLFSPLTPCISIHIRSLFHVSPAVKRYYCHGAKFHNQGIYGVISLAGRGFLGGGTVGFWQT